MKAVYSLRLTINDYSIKHKTKVLEGVIIVLREEIMMKQIMTTALSVLIIFVIGFTAGAAVKKYSSKAHTSPQISINTDAISKK